MSWIKSSRLSNILLVLGATITALLIAEFALRILAPTTISKDPILGYSGVPGVDDWDSNGFRNREALATATIVILGDSQTHGNNATREEAWPQVLGDLASTTIYQMAVGGFGPVQEAYLIDRAIAMQPRLVIVAPYLGNDILDAYNMAYMGEAWSDLRDPEFVIPLADQDSADTRRSIQTGLERGSLEFRLYKIRLWIRSHVRVYELLGNGTRSMREWLGVARTMQEKHAKVAEFAKEHPDIAYIYDNDLRIKTYLSGEYRIETVDLERTRAKEGWRIAQGRYAVIIQKLRDAGIPLLITIIPTKEYVYVQHMEHAGVAVPENLLLYTAKEAELYEAMQEYFKKEGVAVISPLDGMVSALNNGEVVYGETIDGHPLPSGYRVIANDIYAQLKNGIIY